MNLDDYPRTKKLMEETGMDLDQVHQYVENECKKRVIL